MANVIICAPKATAKEVHAMVCPDCKKRTRMLHLYLGTDGIAPAFAVVANGKMLNGCHWILLGSLVKNPLMRLSEGGGLCRRKLKTITALMPDNKGLE